jgi:ABC-type nickel/cobalt efflux system permease component RcnA
MGKQIFDRIKKTLAILLAVFFVVSLTAGSVGAAPNHGHDNDHHDNDHHDYDHDHDHHDYDHDHDHHHDNDHHGRH